jgi:hypothetical protein
MGRMIPNALAMLTKPSGHLVYPHTSDAHLAEAVGLFASTGLREGEAVILIMSASHCEPIRERLEREGFNLQELERNGQLVRARAEELIPTFLIDGIVDEHRFKTIFGGMIEKAKTFNGKRRSVRVFGEMVDLHPHSPLGGQPVIGCSKLSNALHDFHYPVTISYPLT